MDKDEFDLANELLLNQQMVDSLPVCTDGTMAFTKLSLHIGMHPDCPIKLLTTIVTMRNFFQSMSRAQFDSFVAEVRKELF